MTSQEPGLPEIVRALYGYGQEPGLIVKVDRIDSRLERWDGAVSFVKAAATFCGLAGVIALFRLVAGA